MIPGVTLIAHNLTADSRGYSIDYPDFKFKPVQVRVTHNDVMGTLRGMHFQKLEAAQAKIVCCTKGEIFDVVLDLRPESPTYLSWIGHYLSEDNFKMVYIPKGCAHGFQTLTDHARVLYHMDSAFDASAVSGVRWDDPAFGIKWPEKVRRISKMDFNWPDYKVGQLV